MGLAKAREEALKRELRHWRHIPPNGRETYVFEDLRDAARHGAYVQLRYKARPARTPPGGRLRLGMTVNGRSRLLQARVGAFQVMPIPVEWIDEDGKLEITIINADPKRPDARARTSISFLGEDELEVLYQVGSFGMNLTRGLLILWLKLGFLAVLGLCAASFLCFPVASLAALVIFVTAACSGYLLEALTSYDAHEADEQLGWATALMRWMATWLSRLLSQYARFGISDKVADGRLVPWSMVLSCLGWIGALWCGVTGVLAWRIFQARELGREQT